MDEVDVLNQFQLCNNSTFLLLDNILCYVVRKIITELFIFLYKTMFTKKFL